MTHVVDIIREQGKVTEDIRRKFFLGWNFLQIRNWLEKHELDRHMMIELYSTEVAIICPRGLIMQVRASDNNKLGLWGGVLEDGETPEEGAVREVLEETGIEIDKSALEFAGIDIHTHTYANGDQAAFKAFRFIVRLSYIPEVHIEGSSDESNGVCFLTPILDSQREFVFSLLEKL